MNPFSQMQEILAPREVRRTGVVSSVSGSRVRVETEDGAIETLAKNTVGAAQGDTVLIADGEAVEKLSYTYDTQIYYV